MTVIAIKPELLQRLDSAASQQGLTAEGLLEKLLHEARPVPEETDSPLAFLEYAKDAIIIISEDHTILRFNRGAEEIFGYQFAEVFGQTLDVLLPDGTAAIHRQHVSGFAQSEIPAMQMARQRQVFGKRKSGEQFPVQVSISRFYSDGRL
ncbi:MAG: PAS domain S-box protein, partial [Chloroflexota bacterium]